MTYGFENLAESSEKGKLEKLFEQYEKEMLYLVARSNGGSARSYLDNLGTSFYLHPRSSRNCGGERRCLHLTPNCCKAHWTCLS